MECQQYGRDSRYLHTLEELFLMCPFMADSCFGQLLQLRKDEAEEHYSCVAAKEDKFGKPVFVKYFYSHNQKSQHFVILLILLFHAFITMQTTLAIIGTVLS